MNKIEIEKVKKAIELIEKKREKYSCHALSEAGATKSTTQKYASFLVNNYPMFFTLHGQGIFYHNNLREGTLEKEIFQPSQYEVEVRTTFLKQFMETLK